MSFFHFSNFHKGDPQGDILCDMQDWISYLRTRSTNSKTPVPPPAIGCLGSDQTLVPFGQHTMNKVQAGAKLASIKEKLGSEPVVKESAVAVAPLKNIVPTPAEQFIELAEKAPVEDAAWVAGFCAETDAATDPAHLETDMAQHQQDLVVRKASQSNGDKVEHAEAPLCDLIILCLPKFVVYLFSSCFRSVLLSKCVLIFLLIILFSSLSTSLSLSFWLDRLQETHK